MKLLYKGKTKDIYEAGEHSLRMVFTDRGNPEFGWRN